MSSTMTIPHTFLRYAGPGAVATLIAALVGLAPAQAGSYAGPSAAVEGSTLQITGTNAADDVVLTFPTDGSAAFVDYAGGQLLGRFDRRDFASVSVSLGNGDDHFRVVSGAPLTDSPITVDGGNGDDTLLGGNVADVLIGGRGNDTIDGGVGADIEFLGQGDDTARWVPGEGSDVVHGGFGEDTLAFDGGAGADAMVLNATGEQSTFFRQPGNIRMDMDSVEVLALKPLAGADRLTINGTDAPEAVAVRDDAGVVDVDGLLPRTEIIGAEKADGLQINTLGGRDSVQVDPTIANLITASVDLGADQ
jgi:Ca2+-binding RTX toxin-like protein